MATQRVDRKSKLTRQTFSSSTVSSRGSTLRNSKPTKISTDDTFADVDEDFDIGIFFNFAEKYGDDPYMSMATNMFEKAPKGTALRSHTMMQALSRRYAAEKKPDVDALLMDDRDKLVSKQVVFNLPSVNPNTGEVQFASRPIYRLPVDRDKQSREARVGLLKFLDSQNSGRMSIDDLKFGFARVISMPGLDDPDHMLDEVIRLSQKAVQELMLDGAPRKEDDVLTKEFRVFLTYVQGYVDMWEIFCEADSTNTETVDLEEFISVAPKLKEWGMKDPALIKNPAQVYQQIDCDDSGYVTFGEFADFCVGQGLMEDVARDLRNA